eukprot:m.31626 g.31626  ORF g.31626 m.31626 type:complete len:180 (+) comp16495_c0_seq1:281-820(+)
MGQLFSRLWSLWSTDQHKLIIVGLDNAGKTTILYQFLLNEVVETSPTIGSNVEEVVFNNFHFIMWDIGGQDVLRPTWATYYTGTTCLIVVVDSTDHDRIGVARAELHKMLAHEDLRQTQVLIFANKQDSKDAMSSADIMDKLALTKVKEHSYHIQPCCALTGEGLYDGMQWVTEQLSKK